MHEAEAWICINEKLVINSKQTYKSKLGISSFYESSLILVEESSDIDNNK